MTTLTVDIIAQHFYDIYSIPGSEVIYTIFDFADIGLRNQVTEPAFTGTIGFPANHGSNIFSSAADMASYYWASASATLISEINTAQTVFTYAAGAMITIDEATQLIINTKQDQNSNLDKLSSVSFANSSLLCTDATAANIVNAPISAFVAGALNSANSSALGAAITLPYSSLTGTPSIPSVARNTSSISPSLVGPGATGTQVHATKDSTVRVCVSTSATANISGGAVSSVALKICATNNSTEASWTTVATSETSQSYTLAVAIQGVTGMKEQIETDVPGGWYYKLVNSGSGTHAESILSAQQTIYG